MIAAPPKSTIPTLEMPWLDAPDFAARLDRLALDAATKQQIQDYATNGYLIVDLDVPNFAELSRTIVQQLAPDYRGGRIHDAWFYHASVRQLAILPQVLTLLETLYQRRPVPFQTLNFPVGTQQPTHSDTIHFHSVPARFMCGVWIALEDIDAENGPLHYYPGSHKLPIFDFADLGLRPGYENYPIYEQFMASFIATEQLKPVQLSVQQGQAIVWAANLLHGGSPILDPSRTRHSQVTHYFFENCLYYKPMLSTGLQKRLFEVVDIQTRRIVPHTLNGKTVGYRDAQAIKTLLSKKLRSTPAWAALVQRWDEFRRGGRS